MDKTSGLRRSTWGSRGKRAKNAKVILGWRRKGVLRVISPKCGGKWRPYPSPITDEENARFVRQLTQYLYSQSVVGLWHIWFRYSGNPSPDNTDDISEEAFATGAGGGTNRKERHAADNGEAAHHTHD